MKLQNRRISHGRFLIVLWSLCGLMTSAVETHAEIIPANRRMDWSHAGVPGGIPTRTTIFINVATTTNLAYKCFGDGTTDNSAALSRAINDCPAGQVVFVPAGIYRLNNGVGSAFKSNITLRGEGPGKTIFMPYSVGGYAAFSFGTGDWPRPTGGVAITGGATNGGTVLTVGNTSVVNVGALVRIDPVNPTWVHNLNGQGNNPTMSFMFKAVSKTATTVTITPRLPFDLSAMSPKLVAYSSQMIEGVGLEDFTVDLDHTNLAATWVEQAGGCWLSNLEIKNSSGRQMWFICVSASEVSHCYTHGTKSGGPNHEGIDFYNDSCWNLIQDNIVYNGGFPGIILGDSRGGCQGNVIAYNYCGNVDVGASDTTGCDISFSHGPHNMLNLAEGNVAGMIMSDGYFGSSSHNTIFRNALTITHPTAIYGLRGIALLHYNTFYNVVGNVLGTPAFPGSPNGRYATETASYDNGQPLVYQLGFPNMGNTYHDGTTVGPGTPPDYTGQPFDLGSAQALDLHVKATLLRWGNYDYFNQATRWETNEIPGGIPVPPDYTLPASLYLTNQPSWWNGVPWPPIGPDLVPMVGKIPAQIRFEALVNNPSISSPPTNQTVLAGQTAGFAVTAGGASPLAYQWQTNGVVILGATNFTYTTPVTTLADNGIGFRVVITNSYSSVTSSVATLTVLPPDLAPPSAPTNVTAIALAGGINLTWTPSTDNVRVLDYRVERSQGGGSTNFMQIGTTVTNTYVDLGLVAGTICNYRLRAADASGNVSGYSAIASAVPAAVPSFRLDASTPAAVKGSAATLTTVAFTPPAGAVLYVLFAGQQALTGITDNRATHLTYSLQTTYGNAGGGDTMVYLYTAPVTASRAMTVSVTQAAGQHALLQVLVMAGADSTTPVGANGGGRGVAGVVSGTYAATRNGSQGWLLYADWTAQAVPTPGANQTLYDAYTVSGQDTYVIIKQNQATPNAGTAVTLNTTTPTGGAQVAYLYFEMNPTVALTILNPGVYTNHFGFSIHGASNQTVVVEACTNLAAPVWVPLKTNTLDGGPANFSDPSGLHPTALYYRLRSQ